MLKRITALTLAAILCLSLLPVGALAFSPDFLKANITKISVGAPITGVDGRKYLPVDVHITAQENLSSSNVAEFLEGSLKTLLQDGRTAEGIRGLGMTLMGPLKPDAPLDSNMWNWTWDNDAYTGTGVLKYNIPLLESGEAQTVEKSDATGLTEVNGLTVGDQVTFQNETVVNSETFPAGVIPGGSVFSEPVTITVDPFEVYPKTFDFTSGGSPDPNAEYTLTVDYRLSSDLNDTHMPANFKKTDTATAKAGQRVEITPPSYPGMVCYPGKVVVESMPAGNVRRYVTYRLNNTSALADKHKVTVKYTLPAGASGIAGYVAETSAEYYEGQKYYIPTPALSGFVPDNRFVEGTMGKTDVSHTVNYTSVPCKHMGKLDYTSWKDMAMHTISCNECGNIIGSEECEIYFTHNAKQHARKCRKCDRNNAENHSIVHRQKDAFKHTDLCYCGYEQDVSHALGKRYFYDWKKGYGQYIVYYAQKCTQCAQKLEGRVYYWDGYWFDMWNDREAFLKLLMEKGYVDDSWTNHPFQKYTIFGVTSLYKIWSTFWYAERLMSGAPYVDPADGLVSPHAVVYLPNELQKDSLSQKFDLYTARISADYGKLLGPSTDVDCVKEWKNAAGKIEAAKAQGKQTPDSYSAGPRLLMASGSVQRNGSAKPWADGETVRTVDDDYVIDTSMPLDDYEFDLTLSESELSGAGSTGIGGAAFSISPKYLASLAPGDHTVTLWVEGVDRKTQEPVAFVVEKQFQVVEFAGEKIATEAMVSGGRYASMTVEGRENGSFGVCDGKAHQLKITLKTPDTTSGKGKTLVEGKDYTLFYYRTNDGKTLAPTREIRAAGEYLITAMPAKDSKCFGVAYSVYTVETPKLSKPGFTLPAGTTAIEDGAFMGDRSIKAVYVGDNCASIGPEAFSNCKKLTQIRLPRLCDIDENAFKGAPLKVIYGPTGLDPEAFEKADSAHLGALMEGTAEKWAADHNIPFIPVE